MVAAALTRLLIVRHGDRWDYENAEWRSRALAAGANVRDPPLSRLGVRQAEETALEISARTASFGGVQQILCSPYLRVLQTAQPLSLRLGLPLRLEEGLAETHHCPGTLPSARERFAYFPSVDVESASVHAVESDDVCHETGARCESYPLGYMRRMLRVADSLSQSLEPGTTTVCYTHAASISLISALLRRELPADESFRFAPCGIFQLERDGAQAPWRLVSQGFLNTSHVTENSDGTAPWGWTGLRLKLWNALLREHTAAARRKVAGAARDQRARL
jgi:broad specificity phosphatase PhoE